MSYNTIFKQIILLTIHKLKIQLCILSSFLFISSSEIFFIERFHVLSVVSYILMGWFCVIVFKDMMVSIPLGGIIWLALGGFFYTIGVIFYALQKIPYMHVVWHFFVMAGSICHFFAVLLYLAPTQSSI